MRCKLNCSFMKSNSFVLSLSCDWLKKRWVASVQFLSLLEIMGKISIQLSEANPMETTFS